MKNPINVIANNKTLMKERDYEKNNKIALDPNNIGVGSHKKARWKCKNHHSWCANVSNRTRHKRGCPYCAHQLPIKGETDLASTNPNLAKEWHPTKNKLNPDSVMPGSHKKARWICQNKHEWEAVIKSRVNGVGCPYCSGKKVLKGFNDLETKSPELAKEWHPTKNEGLKPDNVTWSSGKSVWWLCSFNHERKATIDNRQKGKGCPKCARALRTSFPEQAIFYYIKKVFPDAINGYKEIFDSSMELDIYIPSIRVGIEYDGKAYHSKQSNQLRDAKKYKICKKNNITLIRIVETTKPTLLINCDHKIEIVDRNEEWLNYAINYLCFKLNKRVNADVKKDRKEILAYLENRKVSLLTEYPMIAEEWDYEDNYPLKPEMFAPHSNEKVGWICKKCGNKRKASIGDRTRKKSTGCPVCAIKRAAKKRKIKK